MTSQAQYIAGENHVLKYKWLQIPFQVSILYVQNLVIIIIPFHFNFIFLYLFSQLVSFSYIS